MAVHVMFGIKHPVFKEQGHGKERLGNNKGESDIGVGNPE
jgi:hypothetical protein